MFGEDRGCKKFSRHVEKNVLILEKMKLCKALIGLVQ